MRRRKKYKYSILGLLGASLLGFGYAYYEARNIVLRKYSLVDAHIPNNFDNFKIIFISDIHCNRFFSPQVFENLIQRINLLNADVVLLGGDYTLIEAKYSEPFFATLSTIKAEHGVYSVFGNHDFWEDITFIRKEFEEAGINICDNKSYWIKIGNDSIKIGGVGDFWHDQQIISNTTKDLTTDNFCILLSHNPDYIESLTIEDQSKVNLMLSGHTHAGQVTLFGKYAPIMPSTLNRSFKNTGQKYRYGWKKIKNTNLYITSGIGVDRFPFRFFAPPEIVEITLTKNK